MLKITLSLLFIYSSFAAISNNPTKSLSAIRNDIRSLRKSISSLEKSLAKKNNKYVEIVKKRQMVDLEAYKIKAEIKKSDESIASYKKKLDKSYKSLILTSIDNYDMKSLMVKRLSLKRMKEQKKELKNLELNKKKLKDIFTGLVTEYQQFIKYEDELLETIQNIEKSKKDYVERYVLEKENFEKEKSKKKFANTQKRSRKKKVASQKNSQINERFEAPISKHFAHEANGKGITFKTKIKEGIKASRDGKVVYTGTLANFGNVVMIDHGNELRSIYLGDFNSSIKKDQPVKVGQIIGQVKSQIRKDQFSKIYFEIRKKNKVQNTVKLVKNFNARG